MSSLLERTRRARRAVRRRVLARRRILAALCVGVAVAAALHAVAAPPPPTVAVLSASRDLPAGAVIGADDLSPAPWSQGSVPEGLAHDPIGRVLAAPLRAGEPVTDVRLVGPGLAAAHPDLTTLPVRLPDAGAADLLEVGDRIDLIATDPQAGGSRIVASDVLVLATPPPTGDASATTSTPGALVLLGVAPTAAPEVSEAAVRWFLSFAFTR